MSARPVRVLVTGGRDFSDGEAMRAALERMRTRAGRDLVIVHGACPTGADALAELGAEP